MRLTTLSLVIFLLTLWSAAFGLADTEGRQLSRSYLSKLVAARNDVLNGAYLEGARLFERQDCGGTQCPDGCFKGTNDICCPVGGGACDAGEGCCGSNGCVPLDGSVCCADGGYCNPGRLCATYQNEDVCCINSGCTELEQSDGSTYTITDGAATPMGTGAITTVPAGAGNSPTSSSTPAVSPPPMSSTLPANPPYANISTSSTGPATPPSPTVTPTASLYTIETISPTSAPLQPTPSSVENPPSPSASPPQPTPNGPSIVIVTSEIQPTVVYSQSTQTSGTLTVTQGVGASSTSTPGFTGAGERLEVPAWIGALVVLYFL